MSEQREISANILSSLRDERSRWLQRLAELIVDEVLDRRVDQLVTPEEVLRVLDACLAEEASAATIDRHLKPMATRERARAAESGERLGEAMKPETAEELIRILRKPFPLNPKIVNDMVEQGAVRNLLGRVLQEAIVGFVSSSKKVPGMSRAAGLVGKIGRRASKGILGDVGRGIERQLDKHVSEFLDQSMARITGKLAELVMSESSLKMQAKMRADMMQKALKTRVSFYYDEAAKLSADEVWALVPPIIAHNLARPVIRDAVTGEVQRFLEMDGARTARALLEELGNAEQVQALAVETVLDTSRHVVATEAFEQWIGELLWRAADDQ